ncbi:unnamed protein product [Moneuplotes crassus]|uniref:Autophagy-related protein n=1 Tax=Euplotes crassus TaxID=5936 RepID=A0AAD1Y4S9_EUPCR|nr:unnamed protein product [Moneuplotes crassus]|mmetsp:Transcript_1040/g.1042  ORF Transcript_1040/g.1042 Transcript_1040/m.1042 type:complete len:116 (-) Transcript_1040:64-411(-)|eukprot:CAMPEP_0197000700 /NCGR_PEP_ID=MMETSP1380-20130617/5573_1 /TAXON_ID=5936 /ORGANISM="Euplotes crassus, Strain CT5" /LENGTH=115 /DNA_ID=CAMNT_0042418083 /DNA_START=14 /DNA_END=361 /DNA_ORIENTATION=+
MKDFKSQPLEKRKSDSKKVLKKFPTKVPIICYKDHNSVLPSLEKDKYLIPKSLKVLEFEQIIRKKISLGEKEALAFFVNEKLMPKKDSTMDEVYAQNKDEDGFLYIVYMEENISG